MKQIFMLRGGRALEYHHRSHLCVVATLVVLVHQMAKRSHPCTDEASIYAGASSKSKPVDTVRHAKSSLLISSRASVCLAEVPQTSSVQSDRDRAGGKITGKRVLLGNIGFGNHLLRSWSKDQSTIALSSGEAELYAAMGMSWARWS